MPTTSANNGKVGDNIPAAFVNNGKIGDNMPATSVVMVKLVIIYL
jgi:hypothetical protein